MANSIRVLTAITSYRDAELVCIFLWSIRSQHQIVDPTTTAQCRYWRKSFYLYKTKREQHFLEWLEIQNYCTSDRTRNATWVQKRGEEWGDCFICVLVGHWIASWLKSWVIGLSASTTAYERPASIPSHKPQRLSSTLSVRPNPICKISDSYFCKSPEMYWVSFPA